MVRSFAGVRIIKTGYSYGLRHPRLKDWTRLSNTSFLFLFLSCKKGEVGWGKKKMKEKEERRDRTKKVMKWRWLSKVNERSGGEETKTGSRGVHQKSIKVVEANVLSRSDKEAKRTKCLKVRRRLTRIDKSHKKSRVLPDVNEKGVRTPVAHDLEKRQEDTLLSQESSTASPHRLATNVLLKEGTKTVHKKGVSRHTAIFSQP